MGTGSALYGRDSLLSCARRPTCMATDVGRRHSYSYYPESKGDSFDLLRLGAPVAFHEKGLNLLISLAFPIPGSVSFSARIHVLEEHFSPFQ